MSEPSPGRASGTRTAAVTASSEPAPGKLRVLVVDDDFATRLLACEALLGDGFAPIEAADGKEAVEQFDRYEPDAILLDINMPEFDGYEVCRRIRRRPGGVATSILVMTATDDVDAVERAFAAGATDFLTKPLNLPLLAHRVRYMLRAAEATTNARDTAARLVRVQRLARLVHWQISPDGTFSWASDPLEVFWPDAPDDHHRADPLLSFVHPDDRERVEAVLAARGAHQIDFRLQLPDGSERVVHQDAELDITDRGMVVIGATQDITELKLAEQQIAQLAFYDDLTGIPNRQLVDRYLRHVDPAGGWSAIAIELGTGHLERLTSAGRDQLIRAATARVIERVRGADLDVRLDQVPRPIESFTGNVVVARTGPDELLVLTGDTAPGAAASTARRLAEALILPIPIAGHDLVLRPRFGVVDYPDPVRDLRQLPDLAHASMIEAQRTTLRNLVVFTASARERNARRGDLAYQLALALDAAPHHPQPELGMTYVPRVEPASRLVIGVRAEPRWYAAGHDPRLLREVLAADPALRDRLARWTLEQACYDAAGWRASGVDLGVAIELSYALVGSPGLTAELGQLLEVTGLDPAALDVELGDLPADDNELARLASALGELRALGVRIALSHVGDACSIGDLRRLPLDTLQLDRSALERLGDGLLATVATIAQALRLRIAVAEIDTPAALAALDPYAPDELCGALFGAGVPAAQVPGLAMPSLPPTEVAAVIDAVIEIPDPESQSPAGF